ncbi:hypothetical protein AK830_g3849 [Neonectria ditissima]|uniref:Uncharacterized protein n=1 Tax=Neonectria ditissima TaxID=78410 RepID=A0A0P7BAM5_9HYPO|nr:hypothetical protein AK830_g3849 [Neonectria ditissima]
MAPKFDHMPSPRIELKISVPKDLSTPETYFGHRTETGSASLNYNIVVRLEAGLPSGGYLRRFPFALAVPPRRLALVEAYLRVALFAVLLSLPLSPSLSPVRNRVKKTKAINHLRSKSSPTVYTAVQRSLIDLIEAGPASLPPSEDEQRGYYYGLPSRPRLVPVRDRVEKTKAVNHSRSKSSPAVRAAVQRSLIDFNKALTGLGAY